MITSEQNVARFAQVTNVRLLSPETDPRRRRHQFVPALGSPEAQLWGEVLLCAIDDFKTYMAYRKDPVENPLSAKVARLIIAEGCDPEYWIFGRKTGFSTVCIVLNVEPDCIRRFLRNWLRETHDMEPTY